MSASFVEKFTHLKDRPKADHALPLLQRIASLVKPIMRKRKWKLPVLSEFFPDNPNLLGMNENGGERIFIRLRLPFHPDRFYDEDDLVGTMLHELTHNVHGPHDGKFYKFLEELEDEYTKLKQSGYSGEGFHSNGKRLGAGVSHNLPLHLARTKAVEAAERRKKLQTVMGGGGRKLGGRLLGNPKESSPRELAVQAAERRARDEKACVYNHGEEVQREADRAAENSVENEAIDVIDLTDDSPEIPDSEDRILQNKSAGENNTKGEESLDESSLDDAFDDFSQQRDILTSFSTISSADTSSTNASGTSKRQIESPTTDGLVKRPRQDTFWDCSKCTLHNGMNETQCAVCGAVRPGYGWTCPLCTEADIPDERWSCPFCGTIKRSS